MPRIGHQNILLDGVRLGEVELLEVMGTDRSITEAARVSYGLRKKPSVSESGDMSLLRYLMRHRHCYHGSMEVLTAQGWRKWCSLQGNVEFMVPDPATRTLRREWCALEKFDADEPLLTFSNARMAYSVTSDHRMYFKGKYRKDFAIVRAQDMGAWGYFDPACGYHAEDEAGVDWLAVFVGFWLGDGSHGSTNRLAFNLRKPRKLRVLSALVRKLGLGGVVCPDRTSFVTVPAGFHDWASGKARTKRLLKNFAKLTLPQLRGLLLGLRWSDGSRVRDRQSWAFSSMSSMVATLYQNCASLLGYGVVMRQNARGLWVCRDTRGSRLNLESRKHYHGVKQHKGKVYCATTSTGLLMVRGSHDTFGFVCGNTSPFEMCEAKWYIKCPIFVARQWIRHRTANVNEISGRYVELGHETYLPKRIPQAPGAGQSKQGRGTGEIVSSARLIGDMAQVTELTKQNYEAMVGGNGAREVARIGLTLGTMTEFVWKNDLHNTLRFLLLRTAPDAQKEIRLFAEAMEEMLAHNFPWTIDAWRNYRKNSQTFSAEELQVLRRLLKRNEPATVELVYKLSQDARGFSDGERRELQRKLSELVYTLKT